MRTCPNCHDSVPEGKYCPNCGYLFPARDAGGRNKRRRRWIIAGAGALAVIALCLFLFLPRPGFENIQRRRLIDPALALLGGAAEAGKLSADLELTAACDEPLLSPLLRGSGAALKLELDGGDALVNAVLTVMGSDVLTGYLTYRDGALGFALPQADGNYYQGARLPLPELDAASLRDKARACADAAFSAVNDENLTVTKENGLTKYVFVPSKSELSAMISALEEALGVSLVPPENFVWTLEAKGARLRAVVLEIDGVTVRLQPRGIGVSGTVSGPGFEAAFEISGDTPLTVTLALEGDPLGVGIDDLSFTLTASVPSTAREPEGKVVDISGYNILEVIELARGLVSTLTGELLGEFGGLF